MDIILWILRLVVALLIVFFITYHLVGYVFREILGFRIDKNDDGKDTKITDKRKIQPVLAEAEAENDELAYGTDDGVNDDLTPYLIGAINQLKVLPAERIHVAFIVNDGEQILGMDEEGFFNLPLAIRNCGPMQVGSHYLNSKNKIVIAKYVYIDSQVLEFSSTLRLFMALHEYRHKWQWVYARKKYYEKNAYDPDERVDDIAEVDADAYAAMYLEHCTPYRLEDDETPASKMAMCAFESDGGMRYRRKAELEAEFFPEG